MHQPEPLVAMPGRRVLPASRSPARGENLNMTVRDILSSPDSLTGLQTSNITGGVGGQMSEKVVYSYNTHLK